jgi:hypothetical protein
MHTDSCAARTMQAKSNIRAPASNQPSTEPSTRLNKFSNTKTSPTMDAANKIPHPPRSLFAAHKSNTNSSPNMDAVNRKIPHPPRSLFLAHKPNTNSSPKTDPVHKQTLPPRSLFLAHKPNTPNINALDQAKRAHAAIAALDTLPPLYKRRLKQDIYTLTLEDLVQMREEFKKVAKFEKGEIQKWVNGEDVLVNVLEKTWMKGCRVPDGWERCEEGGGWHRVR